MRIHPLLMCAVVAVFVVSLPGCMYAKAAPSGPEFAYRSQDRPDIRESRFSSDQAVLGNDQIEAILKGRITLPRDERLALLQLGEHRSWWYGWSDPADLQARLAQVLVGDLQSCKRLRDVAVLPSLLVPERLAVPYLREAAARYQAGMLLVYRTSSRTYTRERFAKKDQVKVFCTVEAILLDVRTGIVPFTSTVTEEYTATRQRDDFGLSETVENAESEALTRAFHKLAQEATAFLDSAP